MENWIKGLYYRILKQEHKISEIIMAPLSGRVYLISSILPGDITVQEWIDKLQDK